jgi:hypothetical protein
VTAKNRKKADEDPLDRNYTPKWVVDRCVLEVVLPYYGHLDIQRILEPSAGGGVFVDAMRVLYPNAWIEAVDLDPEAGPWPKASWSWTELDFLETRFSERFDLIIGNPPYTIAQAFIEHALQFTDNLIFILRQGFMSSNERAPFFRKYPPTRAGILPNRPSFTNDRKTDSADYAWLCWGGKPSLMTELFWLREIPISERDF